MNTIKYLIAISMLIVFTSCVSKKKYIGIVEEKEIILQDCKQDKAEYERKLTARAQTIAKLNAEIEKKQAEMGLKDDQMGDLKNQIADLKKLREQQMEQVGDLTVLSKKASDNVGETIKQIEKKDKYIQLIQAAKSRTDSLNLALAINLKSVLRDGIEDKDIDVKIDKTVVYINISDKMLFQSGSSNLTPQSKDVLAKIAQIAQSRPELDLMVEGYTDNVRINNSCITDNWDLSVKRSAEVVRTLQSKYGINPDKLIAAGRGEYNKLSDNNSAKAKAMNRRTRIILLPQLSQFYDLLKPEKG